MSETKGWPTRELTVGDGYDWKVKVYEPSLQEFAELQAIYSQERPDWEAIKKLVSGLIASWDAVDRKGQPLSVPTKESPELLNAVPQIALKVILFGVLNVIERAVASDPKVTNTSES